MRNIDDIIFAVFNEETLNLDEEELLAEKSSDIYDFYDDKIKFYPEILTQLHVTLQNRIKDIKIISKCKECGEEYRIRYKYIPYLEYDDMELCDKCIENFAFDYVTLRKIEKHFKLVWEEHGKLETFYSKKFSKIAEILKDVTQGRQEIGKWLSEYSRNYSIRIDEVTAYYEIDDNTVYISSNPDKGEKINSIRDIKQFGTLKVKYDSDCKNIELRFRDYCKRPYSFQTNKKSSSYNWIVPNGMSLKLDNYYDGDYESSEFHFE